VHSPAGAQYGAVNQGVLQTLMIPLALLVFDELGHRSSEMPFPQWDHPVETLFLDRSHKPLIVREP